MKLPEPLEHSMDIDGGGGVTRPCSCCGAEATHATRPCGCLVFCKRCAMKVATGGKCRACGNFFGGVSSLPPARSVDAGADDDDSDTDSRTADDDGAKK